MKSIKVYWIAHILMPATIILAFLWAPPAELLGHASKVLYFHMPLAWGSVLAFLIAGVLSIAHLADRGGKYALLDEKAYNSASIGMVFTILTIISGSMWAKISWGSYWNWDPRETSITVLLLIYIAYFSLRSSLKNNPNRANISSVYLIFTMVTVPFFVFIIPRLYPSLHPNPVINPERKINMDPSMRVTLLIAVISFTMLYFYLLDIKNRISLIQSKLKEKEYEQ